VNVPAKPIQLRYHHWAFVFPAVRQGCGQLWPAFNGIRPLAGLDLHEHPAEFKALGLSNTFNGLPLRL